MNETNDFERLIADVAREAMGPTRPVDLERVTHLAATSVAAPRASAVTHPADRESLGRPERGLSVFSAVKLVAAASIIALIGGFLMAGLIDPPEEAVPPAALDAAPVTHVTGTRVSAVEDTTDEEWWAEDGVGHSRGMRATETVEWSDPRLPSELQVATNLDTYWSPVGEFRETVFSGTSLMEGPDGYWTGEFTAYCDDSDCYGLNTITGHGAYEGLYAVLRAFDDIEGPEDGDWVLDGLLFEGEMPPLPEAMEPSTD